MGGLKKHCLCWSFEGIKKKLLSSWSRFTSDTEGLLPFAINSFLIASSSSFLSLQIMFEECYIGTQNKEDWLRFILLVIVCKENAMVRFNFKSKHFHYFSTCCNFNVSRCWKTWDKSMVANKNSTCWGFRFVFQENNLFYAVKPMN